MQMQHDDAAIPLLRRHLRLLQLPIRLFHTRRSTLPPLLRLARPSARLRDVLGSNDSSEIRQFRMIRRVLHPMNV
jgi:hypothetical protein